jgi:hypothetical protein
MLLLARSLRRSASSTPLRGSVSRLLSTGSAHGSAPARCWTPGWPG